MAVAADLNLDAFRPGAVYEVAVSYRLADGTSVPAPRTFVVYEVDIREDILDPSTGCPRVDLIVAWDGGAPGGQRVSWWPGQLTVPASPSTSARDPRHIGTRQPNDPKANDWPIMAAQFRRGEEFNAAAGFPGRPQGYR